MIDTSLFPYDSFPVRLEIKAENRIAWFKDDYDLQKHLNRYKLDKRTIKIDYRDEQPTKSSKTNKRELEPKSKSKSNGSSSPVRKRKPKLDTTGNTSSNAKRKK
jgi:hypothetical protein